MNYLTTGQASKLLSVTPDTILKWVKQGRLPAIRTAGGHNRISREDINALISRTTECPPTQSTIPEKSLVYCWEFFNENDRIRQACRDCLVYKSQALKCFEMNHLSHDLGFNGGSCSSSCTDCSYFRYQRGRPYNVLIITDNDACRESLVSEEKVDRIRLSFASCEYECSLLIERFRPDFVVVDCAMQEDKCRELCSHLANDPRIKGNAIILATPVRRPSVSFPGTMRIGHPLTMRDLEDYLSKYKACSSIRFDKVNKITGEKQ